MDELVRSAPDVQTATLLSRGIVDYAWLKYSSLDKFLDSEGWGCFHRCAALLKDPANQVGEWRPNMQAGIRLLDSGSIPEGLSRKTISTILYYALGDGRCDLVERALQRLPRQIKDEWSYLVPLRQNIETLSPIAASLLARLDLSSPGSTLGLALSAALLPHAIPYLGNTPSGAIAQSCTEENIHEVVASGLCSYEQAGLCVLQRQFRSWNARHVIEVARGIPVLPELVEFARNHYDGYLCWYWVIYASEKEREDLLAIAHHTRCPLSGPNQRSASYASCRRTSPTGSSPSLPCEVWTSSTRACSRCRMGQFSTY